MGRVQHGKRLYKQMALEVAVRNPERYEGILKTFSKFDGLELDDSGILAIYVQLYLDRVVESQNLEESDLNEDYLAKYIKEHNSHQNEWGFPTGYQAAFCRYLKTLSEFGFIYSQYKEPLRLSAVGKAVADGEITLSEGFALQSMRFWRKSPYRRVLNDFNYFEFIIKVIRKLNEAGKKLSMPQFMLSLFSENGDVDAFIAEIQKNKIGDSYDKAYQYAVRRYSECDDKHNKVVKQSSAFNDYGNTVFRVLQLTGFISVDYAGVILLSVNQSRMALFDELTSCGFTVSEAAKDSEEKYFDELGSLKQSIMSLILKHRTKEDMSTAEYNKKIPAILKTYKLDRENLAAYLQEIADGEKDRRAFWFIQAPVKFELILTLFLYACYGDEFAYKPNFKCDDYGIPYSHAPGDVGDIEIYNSTKYWLVEATLIRNKNQQINSETINLFRHIASDVKQKSYLSLVAPYIHTDTDLLIQVAALIVLIETKRKALDCKAEAVTDFIKSALIKENFNVIEKYTEDFRQNIKDTIGKIA